METSIASSIGSKGCVLVTDGDERSALAVTRGLGQAGIPVVVGAETDSSLAGASRYCVSRWRYPSPLTNPMQFISSLAEAIRQLNISAVMPVTDASMQAVTEYRERLGLSKTHGLPSWESYNSVSDKYGLCHLAVELGVPIPSTIFVEQGVPPADTEVLGDYPLIVKPRRSLMSVNGHWARTSVHRVGSREELNQLYRTVPYLREPSLIQKCIEGEGQGVFALCNAGDPVALFAHRRLREKPPSGGVSVLRESIALPKEMTDHAVRLLKKVGWHGVAMVEFKVEHGTGIPNLMEINGRFWGSLQLALDAGLNLPNLLYRLAVQHPVAMPASTYRTGVRSRWLLGDLDHLLMRTFKSDEALRLPSGYPSRLRSTTEFVHFWQKDLYYEIERWDDLGPARYELQKYIRHLVKGHS
ncbi:conserved protein of unknown function [Nitrospira japonica]|uniref:ATP-grasp domain-containing protein n=1 Tax=Nitrospira japonica TaxID=1325564 RepID=A0A1W1IB19_9BACT|nr:conserved protein of unknown function [Nitrospira japonica]